MERMVRLNNNKKALSGLFAVYNIMKRNIYICLTALLLLLLANPLMACKNKTRQAANTVANDTVKNPVDTAAVAGILLTPYKNNVLATYYADKFNGRKTSSGEVFDNKKYTAAHMKLPFGTIVRVTNPANGKWVDVKVNDRGPYDKKLEIDLTKKAFMEIASKKGAGTFKVNIEIIEPQ